MALPDEQRDVLVMLQDADLSQACKLCLYAMLQPHPDNRPTVEDALRAWEALAY